MFKRRTPDLCLNEGPHLLDIDAEAASAVLSAEDRDGHGGRMLNVVTRAEQVVGAATALELLEDLYDSHYRVALGLACRILRNPQDAEETVQEAFLSVWRKAAMFDGTRGSTRTWVLAAVRNRAIDTIRARKRRPLMDRPGAEVHDAECDVAATAVASVDRECVIEALASLSLAQRNALELAYFGGFSHTEIAEQLHVPVGTVKGRLRLALDHLRLTLATETHVMAA